MIDKIGCPNRNLFRCSSLHKDCHACHRAMQTVEKVVCGSQKKSCPTQQQFLLTGQVIWMSLNQLLNVRQNTPCRGGKTHTNVSPPLGERPFTACGQTVCHVDCRR